VSVPVSLAGVTYAIPTEGDLDWGDAVTGWIQAASEEIDDLIDGGGGGGGVDTVGAFSTSGDSKGLDITGTTVTLHAATATHPGGVSTGTQTFAGNKTFTGSITGSGGFVGALTGNASTATAFQTPRTINGTSFDGTANITVTAAAGTLTGTTLAAGVTASSLTSVGTLANLTVTNPITGSVTGSAASATGNAATATALQNARTINGVSFNGTANITVADATKVGLTGNESIAGVKTFTDRVNFGDAGLFVISDVYGVYQEGDATNSFEGPVNFEKWLEVGTTANGYGIRFSNDADPPILTNDGIDGGGLLLTGGSASFHIEGDLTVDGAITGDVDITGTPQEYLDLENTTQSNPSSGFVRLYGRTAGKTRPSYRSPDSGRPTDIGSYPGSKHVMWREAIGAGTGAVTHWGMSTATTGGASSVVLTTTNIRTQMLRLQYDTNTAASNSNGWRSADQTHWRGNATGLGGWDATQRFGFRTVTPADARFYTGWRNSLAQIGTTVEPSSLIDVVGVGFDSTQNTFYFIHNDGSGTATQVNTTLTPSITEYYELNIYAAPNASSIQISLEELGSGTVATANLSSDLPTATLFLGWHFHVNSGPTGGAAFGSDWTNLYVEREL
jgi:hypothetical protein